MSTNVPTTEWRPPGDTGEMSNGTSYKLVDQNGNYIVTQDSDNISTGVSMFTMKPDTLWNQLADFINAIQDEMGLYILDEMSQPIEDESVATGVLIPDTRWTPPIQGEMSSISSVDIITQLGFLVTQDGDSLITGTSLYITTPDSEWLEDDSI